jgi:hypothetical protein
MKEHVPQNMSQNRKPLDFVVGDLVYFVGYEGPSDRNKLGVVIEVKVKTSHFPLYVVHWFKDELQSTHTATHIDLAYTTDLIDDEVSPKSLLHLKDRVYDRSEGD